MKRSYNLVFGILATIVVVGSLLAASARRPTPDEFDCLVGVRDNIQSQLGSGTVVLGHHRATNVSEYGVRTVFLNPGWTDAGNSIVVDLPVATNRNVGLTYRFISRGTNRFVITNDFNQSIQTTNTGVPIRYWGGTNAVFEVMSSGTNWHIISMNQNIIWGL